MDQVMGAAISDWYLFQGVNGVIGFHRIVGPRLLGLTPDEAAISAAMPLAHAVFGWSFLACLATRPTLHLNFAGIRVTIADLMVAPHMDFLSQTPEWTALTRARPNLIDWLGRMNERNCMQQTTWEAVAQLAEAG